MISKTAPLSYAAATPGEEAFFRALQARVQTEIQRSTRAGTLFYHWFRAVLYLGLYWGIWWALSFHGSSFGASTALALCLAMGFVGTGVALNLGHESTHGVFGPKPLNRFILWLGFSSIGIDAWIWESGHLESHHRYVNLEGRDIGTDGGKLLRLTRHQAPSKFQRYQHLYGPWIYFIYTINWLLVRDFKIYAHGSQAGSVVKKTPLRLLNLIAVKAVYFILTLWIPYRYSGFGFAEILTGWVAMHFVISLYTAVSLFTSHINARVSFPRGSSGTLSVSWIRQQLSSTFDIHPTSTFLNFIWGGFNAHAIHHLFPQASSHLYPRLSQILREETQKHGMPYHWGSLFEATKLHLQHLKELGANP
ncbi:MAG: fatty acid desaturase [Bdellovibrionales bacterium]|nr:fatty acid desaturase [Bdellovibrionales bacterium]